MQEEFEVLKVTESKTDPVANTGNGAAPQAPSSSFIAVAIAFADPKYVRFESSLLLKFENKVKIEGDSAYYEGNAIGKVLERKDPSDIKVDTSYSIKYTGGYSKDGKTIYLDSRFPQSLNIEGKEISTIESIAKHHELPEKWMTEEGYTYQYAHMLATKIEREYVESLGINWELYSKEVEKGLHAVSSAKLEKSPKNLDLTPYVDSKDEETLKEIEQTMEK